MCVFRRVLEGISWLVCERDGPLLARLRQRAPHINFRGSVAQMRCVDARTRLARHQSWSRYKAACGSFRRVPRDLHYLSGTIVHTASSPFFMIPICFIFLSLRFSFLSLYSNHRFWRNNVRKKKYKLCVSFPLSCSCKSSEYRAYSLLCLFILYLILFNVKSRDRNH